MAASVCSRCNKDRKVFDDDAGAGSKDLQFLTSLRLLTPSHIIGLDLEEVTPNIDAQLKQAQRKIEELHKHVIEELHEDVIGKGIYKFEAPKQEVVQRLVSLEKAPPSDAVKFTGVSAIKDVGWVVAYESPQSQLSLYSLATGSLEFRWIFPGIIEAVIDADAISGQRYIIVSVSREDSSASLHLRKIRGVGGNIRGGGGSLDIRTASRVTSMCTVPNKKGCILLGTTNGKVIDLSIKEIFESKGEVLKKIHPARGRCGAVTALHCIPKLDLLLVGDSIGVLTYRRLSNIEETLNKSEDLHGKEIHRILSRIDDNKYTFIIAETQTKSWVICLMEKERNNSMEVELETKKRELRRKNIIEMQLANCGELSIDQCSTCMSTLFLVKRFQIQQKELKIGQLVEIPSGFSRYLKSWEKSYLYVEDILREHKHGPNMDLLGIAGYLQCSLDSINVKKLEEKDFEDFEASSLQENIKLYNYLTAKLTILRGCLSLKAWCDENKCGFANSRTSYGHRSVSAQHALERYTQECQGQLPGPPPADALTVHITLASPPWEEKQSYLLGENGEKSSFIVGRSETVGAIKRKIHARTGIPFDRQRLRQRLRYETRHFLSDMDKVGGAGETECELELVIDYLLIDRLIPDGLRHEMRFPPNNIIISFLEGSLSELQSWANCNGNKRAETPKESTAEKFEPISWASSMLQSIYAIIFYLLLDNGEKGGIKRREDFLKTFCLSFELEQRVRAFHCLDCAIEKVEERKVPMDVSGDSEKDANSQLYKQLAVCGGSIPEALHCLFALRYLKKHKNAKPFVASVIANVKAGKVLVSRYEHTLCVQCCLEVFSEDAAFQYLRSQNKDKDIVKSLLSRVFESFRKNGKLKTLIKLPLNSAEEDQLEEYLKDHKDILLLYYLMRGNVQRAKALDDRRFSYHSDEDISMSDVKQNSVASMIIQAYRDTFPKILLDGTYEEFMDL